VAKAALADNAASLAAAEHDKEALELAIGAYEDLWALSPNDQQRAALETAPQHPSQLLALSEPL
jgi:hypothetical protein